MTVIRNVTRSDRTAVKAAMIPTLLVSLAVAACSTPHTAPSARAGAAPSITSEAMLPPDNAPGTTATAPDPAVPETAANMGADATPIQPQPIGVSDALPGSAAPGGNQLASLTPMSDSRFTQQAVSNAATEIALARIALLRAQSDEVRVFARRLLVDHRQMAVALDDFGLQRGFMVNWRMSQVGESIITRMRAMPTAQFDAAYVGEMVRAHEASVALLERQASGSSETAALARDALPTIRAHLALARDLQRRG